MTGPPNVDIAIERGAQEVRVTVTGDIDLAGVAALERARAKALDGNPERMLIDLRGVNFVDSSGLGFLLQTERAARSHGCTLRLLRSRGQRDAGVRGHRRRASPAVRRRLVGPTETSHRKWRLRMATGHCPRNLTWLGHASIPASSASGPRTSPFQARRSGATHQTASAPIV